MRLAEVASVAGFGRFPTAATGRPQPVTTLKGLRLPGSGMTRALTSVAITTKSRP